MLAKKSSGSGCFCGRRSGLMVSALDSGSNDLSSSLNRGTALCSWQVSLLSQCLSSPWCINGYRANSLLG